jgi:putative ABC transport system permease protein
MSAKPTLLIARKSVRARLGRTIAIAIAITAGVSFVVGSFVLADSLRATFDDLFGELTSKVDLQVRSAQAFESDDAREPFDPAIADDIRAIEGVSSLEPTVTRFAQLIDDEGEAVSAQAAPSFGVSWESEADVQGVVVKEGAAPSGMDQAAVDKSTADRENLEVGDTITYLTDTGQHTATLTGTVGTEASDSFAGAAIIAVDLATALEVFGTEGLVDTVDIAFDDDADAPTVQREIEAILPAGLEVITGEQLAQESSDAVGQFIDVFGTGLLIFAFVTAFVSAFIINNVFQITIGQRLRELALLRAVGASGRQVRRMITVEAFILGVVATILGIFGGLGVARLLIAAFNAAGAGFSNPQTVLAPRTIVMAALVGVGITMASVIVPARRAGRIPPIAAMRPELGFSAIQTKRLVLGAVLTSIGVVMFLVGLFVRPGGTPGLILFAGGGALILFLGVASLSSTIARPVTRAIGWPVAKLFKTPGGLARDNVARAPRRTSSSAAALMIGVALVSAAAVFAASLRASFIETLETAVKADYIVTDDSFLGLSPIVAETLAEVPEISAVTPIRGAQAEVDGESKPFGAIVPAAFDALVDPDLIDGTIGDLGLDELLINSDPAADLDLEVGSTVTATFQNGVEVELTVAGIYGDSTFGNWLVSTETLAAATGAPARDLFIMAGLAEGVDPAVGDEAVRSALSEFPQANVQSNAEFRQSQEDQINQLLIVISMLLAFAIFIAVLGISITLALGVFERTREIGLLRAVGMNKRQTRRSIRWEAIIVSTFGALIGIVLGTFLGVVLSLAVPEDIVSKLAFNPGIIVAILIGAIIAGFLAALYPSYKASNMNVLDAISTE